MFCFFSQQLIKGETEQYYQSNKIFLLEFELKLNLMRLSTCKTQACLYTWIDSVLVALNYDKKTQSNSGITITDVLQLLFLYYSCFTLLHIKRKFYKL